MVSSTISTIEVLDPSVPPREAKFALAARPNSLNGKVLGLLNNKKPHAEVLLEKIASLLSEKNEFSDIVVEGKVPLAFREESQAKEFIDKLAAKCDVVVNGVSD